RAQSSSASAATARRKDRRPKPPMMRAADPGSGFFVAMDEARRRQRRRADGLHLVGPAHRDAKIVQASVMDAVDQPVHGERLAAPPGELHDRGVADVMDLLD